MSGKPVEILAAVRLVQDVDRGEERWVAVVGGRPVDTTIRYGEFKAAYRESWGRLSFRDFVEEKLREAGR